MINRTNIKDINAQAALPPIKISQMTHVPSGLLESGDLFEMARLGSPNNKTYSTSIDDIAYYITNAESTSQTGIAFLQNTRVTQVTLNTPVVIEAGPASPTTPPNYSAYIIFNNTNFSLISSTGGIQYTGSNSLLFLININMAVVGNGAAQVNFLIRRNDVTDDFSYYPVTLGAGGTSFVHSISFQAIHTINPNDIIYFCYNTGGSSEPVIVNTLYATITPVVNVGTANIPFTDLQSAYDNGNGQINLSTAKPFKLNSNVAGIVVPSMPTSDFEFIPNPDNGLLSWATDVNQFIVNTGTTSVPIYDNLALVSQVPNLVSLQNAFDVGNTITVTTPRPIVITSPPTEDIFRFISSDNISGFPNFTVDTYLGNPTNAGWNINTFFNGAFETTINYDASNDNLNFYVSNYGFNTFNLSTINIINTTNSDSGLIYSNKFLANASLEYGAMTCTAVDSSNGYIAYSVAENNTFPNPSTIYFGLNAVNQRFELFRGLYLPQYTTAEIAGLTSSDSLIVRNTTINRIQYRDDGASVWQSIANLNDVPATISTYYAEMYFEGNSRATQYSGGSPVIIEAGPISPTTPPNYSGYNATILNNFSFSNGVLTFTGSNPQVFQIFACFSTKNVAEQIDFKILVSGSVVANMSLVDMGGDLVGGTISKMIVLPPLATVALAQSNVGGVNVLVQDMHFSVFSFPNS